MSVEPRGRPGLARRTAVRLAGATVLAGGIASVPGPAVADQVLCSEVSSDVQVQTDGANQPYADMRVDTARGENGGAGVTVALVDAGVAANQWLPNVTALPRIAGAAGVDDLSTMVAGLLGGRTGEGRQEPLGLAPGVRLLSLQVHDGTGSTGSEQEVTSEHVAAGIDAAVAAGADIIDVSSATQDSPTLQAAVRRALARQVVVVAALGERPTEGQPGFEEYGTPKPGEDMLTYPAAYPGVLGVSIGNADDVDYSSAIAESQAIDVVAPVAGTVTVLGNGSTCVVDGATTAMAAGEVSGLAALVKAKYPLYTAAQLIAVIMETASGTTEVRSPMDGFGVIQPYEALNRQLEIRPDGTVVQARQDVDRVPRVAPPDPDDDPFLGLRSSLRWWGVLAGGGLVLALLVRPLLNRPRD